MIIGVDSAVGLKPGDDATRHHGRCSPVSPLLWLIPSSPPFRSFALPRPAALAAIQLLMLPGHLSFALPFAFPLSLLLAALLIGFCFGAICSVTPTVAGECFGLRSLGMLYNCLLAAAPLGSYLCSGLLAGYLYEREVERDHPRILADFPTPSHPLLAFPSNATLAASAWSLQRYAGDGGGQSCLGAHCFRLVFLLMALVCLAGAALHSLAAWRTAGLYAAVKARHDEAEAMRREEEEEERGREQGHS